MSRTRHGGGGTVRVKSPGQSVANEAGNMAMLKSKGRKFVFMVDWKVFGNKVFEDRFQDDCEAPNGLPGNRLEDQIRRREEA